MQMSPIESQSILNHYGLNAQLLRVYYEILRIGQYSHSYNNVAAKCV